MISFVYSALARFRAFGIIKDYVSASFFNVSKKKRTMLELEA